MICIHSFFVCLSPSNTSITCSVLLLETTNHIPECGLIDQFDFLNFFCYSFCSSAPFSLVPLGSFFSFGHYVAVLRVSGHGVVVAISIAFSSCLPLKITLWPCLVLKGRNSCLDITMCAQNQRLDVSHLCSFKGNLIHLLVQLTHSPTTRTHTQYVDRHAERHQATCKHTLTHSIKHTEKHNCENKCFKKVSFTF